MEEALGMEEAPSFNLHATMECSSTPRGCLTDITNISEDLAKDFEECLLDEFDGKEIDNYLVKSCGCELVSLAKNNVVSDEKDKKGKCKRFLDLDEALMQEVRSGGINKSESKVKWVRNKFDAWRRHVGLDDSVLAEDLNMKEFAGMLECVILQVVKDNGSTYPTESLQDLFRKFGAMIRRKQEIKVAETGIEEKVFEIRTSPIFKQTRLACIAAMRRSRNTPGICCKRKKVDEVSFGTELALLSDIEHQITDGKGLQKRFLYYVVSRFGIRGQEELAGLVITDFNVERSDGKDVLVYSERLSKNNDVSMSKYQEESFRPPVKCYEEDVVRTFQQLFRHLPKKYETEKGKQYAFMQAIVNPRSNVWYNCKHRVNGRKLTAWMKCMAELVGAEGNFSGKSGRTTLVSRMCRGGVPISVGMDVTATRLLRHTREVYKEELRAQDKRDSSGGGAVAKTSCIPDSSMPMTSATTSVASSTGALIVHSEVMVQDAEPMDDDKQLNEDLEALARFDPVVRRALNLETNERNIMGGVFHNCVIHF